MNKGKFLTIFNTAMFLAQNSYNKLGLVSKRYCNAFQADFETLATEETYEVRAPFYDKDEAGKVKKDDRGNPIVDSTKEKELSAALSVWKKEEFTPEGSFEPIQHLLPKDMLISPDIYDTIQGHVIDIPEETYFGIIEAEQAKS